MSLKKKMGGFFSHKCGSLDHSDTSEIMRATSSPLIGDLGTIVLEKREGENGRFRRITRSKEPKLVVDVYALRRSKIEDYSDETAEMEKVEKSLVAQLGTDTISLPDIQRVLFIRDDEPTGLFETSNPITYSMYTVRYNGQ